MLLFGVINGGLLLNQRESITHAAREGARYGATVAINQCDSGGCVAGGTTVTWAGLVQSIVIARANGDVTKAQVCVALVSGSGTSTSPPTAIDGNHSTNTDGSGCYPDTADTGQRVQVSIIQPNQLDAVMIHIPVTLKSYATAQYEQ
jgi:hypothetical protein